MTKADYLFCLRQIIIIIIIWHRYADIISKSQSFIPSFLVVAVV